ncbi:MAG: hypothetical protein ACXAEF_04120 [Candidatus Thorarchaeota archaeon]|jgi:hypothetical protein
MRKTSIVAILVAFTFLACSMSIQPMAITSDLGATEAPVNPHTFAGFDSENITIVLQTPANQSTVEGTFNMTLDITSVNGPLNLTLFIEDEIYPDYNVTNIGTGIQNVTVDTTTLVEGNLNFTLLFEDNSTGTNDKETYYLIFNVDNHGAPNVEIITPEALANFTGMDDLYLNITSDYPQVTMNITIDGEMTPEFNATIVDTGANNFTINATRYENGEHELDIVVYTEEGLEDSTSITLFFLDHVRFFIRGLTQYDTLMGDAEIQIRVDSPYDSVLFSTYVDDVLAPDVNNITLETGTSTFDFNTTSYSEGEHNFTFKAFDDFGHVWETTWVLVIDNHGAPEVEFISPTDDIVVGTALFTIEIESTWDVVNVSVYIDDNLYETHINVPVGEFAFYIDTNANLTKWEHVVKIVVETEEGETAEVESTFGFANMKVEELASLGILLGLAIFIPLYRRRNGEPLRPVLVLDLVFAGIVVIAFVILGVTNLGFAIWHLNLASIWIIGGILVFLNWVLPLLKDIQGN